MNRADDFQGYDDGPESRQNWLAMIAAKPYTSIQEYPLHTDARITGQAECGPYIFLNTVPLKPPATVQADIILRCRWHLGRWMPSVNWAKTDTRRYHGGDFPDEIASLSSLILGVRIRPGGITRRFEEGGDPLGSPVEWSSRPKPQLIRRNWATYTLPTVVGERTLEMLKTLEQWPLTNGGDALALLRAARLYQDALWLAESEPSLAWLMLVSALETAAVRWRTTKGSPLERLRASNEELYNYLQTLGSDVPSKVAEQIADSLGVTLKFVDFVLAFLPPPPDHRPPEWAQHSWQKEEMRQSLKKIYKLRSKSLHEGTPFPEPMCLPAGIISAESQILPDKPTGHMSARGGVWKAEDTPMFLHTFEYITRGSLLNWWKGIASSPEKQRHPQVL